MVRDPSDNYAMVQVNPLDLDDPHAQRGGTSHNTWVVKAQDMFPDGTSGSSATTVGTTAQSQTQVQRFADAATSHCYIQTVIPNDYWGELICDLIFSATTNTGNVRVSGACRAISTNSTAVFDAAGTAITAQDVAVPGTANRLFRIRMNISALLTGLAPGQYLSIRVAREGGHANDTNAGNLDLYAAKLIYRRG